MCFRSVEHRIDYSRNHQCRIGGSDATVANPVWSDWIPIVCFPVGFFWAVYLEFRDLSFCTKLIVELIDLENQAGCLAL